MVASLGGKMRHNSLGPHIKQERVESERAFHNVVALGVRPGDKFVDSGCGTLRLGVLFIEYLEPDHYFGLDWGYPTNRRLVAHLRRLPRPGVSNRGDVSRIGRRTAAPIWSARSIAGQC